MYVVDFEQMLQQRQTDPSRKRQVKRDLATIPKKGVAGLRLSTVSHALAIGGDDGLDVTGTSASGNITAATDAAIRIASDIIDSTLAHADEYRQSNSMPVQSGPFQTNSRLLESINAGTMVPNVTSDGGDGLEDSHDGVASHRHSHRRELLDEIEETLNISNASSINHSTMSANHIDDFFSIALDDFRNLTINNIATDSSSDDDDDDNVDRVEEHNILL